MWINTNNYQIWANQSILVFMYEMARNVNKCSHCEYNVILLKYVFMGVCIIDSTINIPVITFWLEISGDWVALLTPKVLLRLLLNLIWSVQHQKLDPNCFQWLDKYTKGVHDDNLYTPILFEDFHWVNRAHIVNSGQLRGNLRVNLVNFICALGKIMTTYYFLEASPILSRLS